MPLSRNIVKIKYGFLLPIDFRTKITISNEKNKRLHTLFIVRPSFGLVGKLIVFDRSHDAENQIILCLFLDEKFQSGTDLK